MTGELPYMTAVKVSSQMVSGGGVDNFINRHYPNAKGYLLVDDEDLGFKNMLQCNVCFHDEGFIVVTDYQAVIEDAIKYFIKLNHHAFFKNVEFGWMNDDFARNRISAKLIFNFSNDR